MSLILLIFYSALVLACHADLKKTQVKLELLIRSFDIDMLLMAWKGIRGRIRHAIFQYVKANNTWKIMMKIKSHQILSIGT